MLEPLVVKATRAVPRREKRSNPPDLSNEFEGVILHSYPTIACQYCFNWNGRLLGNFL